MPYSFLQVRHGAEKVRAVDLQSSPCVGATQQATTGKGRSHGEQT